MFFNLYNSIIHREKPLFVEQRKLNIFNEHENNQFRHERDEPVEFDAYVKHSCRLCPDGLDVFNETVYEFYGCNFHGCQNRYKQGQRLYNNTEWNTTIY